MSNPPKIQSQEIYLDSQYASATINTSKKNDCYFFFAVPVIVPQNYDVVMKVENFVCPISFFVVNDTNNTLVTSTGTYTISEGNYNALSLKTELSSKMTGYTITYDSNTNKLTFSSNSSFTFFGLSTCFRIIGFEEDEDHVSSANALTSDFVVNLAGTSLIYIDIPNITTRNILSKNNGGFTTIVKSVVCDVPYGSILTYTNATGSSVVLGEKYISYIQVRLLDDDYNLLDLNGQYFTLSVIFSYEYNGLPLLDSLIPTENEAKGSNLLESITNQNKVKKSLGLS